jgi:hypothetical protein
MPAIAILGWGSLLWDKRPTFDDYHGAWEPAGPELRIEFSRISSTRGGALTLVIDPDHGSICRVFYALSTRGDPQDAICDLRSREGTTRKNIGYYFAEGSAVQGRDSATVDAVRSWAQANHIDVVVWTDLRSNFSKETGKPFSVAAAVAHIQSLGAEAKAAAAEYVWRAPDLVQTDLRSVLQAAPWFAR